MDKHITILIKNASQEDIDALSDICDQQRTKLIKTDERKDEKLKYFSIFTNTEVFNKIKSLTNLELIPTAYTELRLISDESDEWIKLFSDILKDTRVARAKENDVNSRFVKFLKTINDIEVLNEISKYSGHLNKFQEQAITTRKDILLGNDNINEKMTEMIKSLELDIKALREQTGLSRVDFAKLFKIPYRTVEDWENKKSTCSTYLYALIKKDLIARGYDVK